MNAPKRMAYFGHDADFIHGAKNFMERHSLKIELESGVYTPGRFTEFLQGMAPFIVFVDLVAHPGLEESLFKDVAQVKLHESGKQILFVAMVNKDSERLLLEQSVVAGFQYLFIKDCDSESLFLDSIFIGNELRYPSDGFATAKTIDQELQILFLADLTRLSDKEFRIETDFLAPGSHIPFELEMFPDLRNGHFVILESFTASSASPMIYSYDLALPLAGAWDEACENKLSQDTIDSWVAENLDRLSPETPTIHLVSKQSQLVNDHRNKAFDLHCIGSEINAPFLERIKVGHPAILFIEFDMISELEHGMNSLTDLFDFLKKSSSRPIIVMTSSPSSSVALQKIFEYPKIISTEGPLLPGLILTIAQKFCESQDQGGKSRPAQLMSLDRLDKDRVVRIPASVRLMEISEHELTFFSKTEIPYFTVIEVTHPLRMFATVIPAYRKLPARAEHFSYTALIHGTSEDELKFLRQFINQIIFQPLDDFSPGRLTKMMDHIYAHRPAEKEVVLAAPPAVNKNSTEVEDKKTVDLNKRMLKGKTKL